MHAVYCDLCGSHIPFLSHTWKGREFGARWHNIEEHVDAFEIRYEHVCETCGPVIGEALQKVLDELKVEGVPFPHLAPPTSEVSP